MGGAGSGAVHPGGAGKAMSEIAVAAVGLLARLPSEFAQCRAMSLHGLGSASGQSGRFARSIIDHHILTVVRRSPTFSGVFAELVPTCRFMWAIHRRTDQDDQI